MNQFMLIVKPHVDAGGAAPDDLASLVQSGRQCPVSLVYRNLFNPTVLRDLGAVGVEPGVVGRSWWSNWHGKITSGAGWWKSRAGNRVPGSRFPAVTGAPAVLGRRPIG
jgi:hypothetical protein